MKNITLKKENAELFSKGANFTENFDLNNRVKVKGGSSPCYKGLVFNGIQAVDANGNGLLVPDCYLSIDAYRDWWNTVFPKGRVVECNPTRNDTLVFNQNDGVTRYVKEVSLNFYTDSESQTAKTVGYGSHKFSADDDPNDATRLAFAEAWKHGMANLGFGTDLDWEAWDSSLDTYIVNENANGEVSITLYEGDVMLGSNCIRKAITTSKESESDPIVITTPITLPENVVEQSNPAKVESFESKEENEEKLVEVIKISDKKDNPASQVSFDLNEFIVNANADSTETDIENDSCETEVASEDSNNDLLITDETVEATIEDVVESESDTENSVNNTYIFEVFDTAPENIKKYNGMSFNDIDLNVLRTFTKPSSRIRKHLSKNTLDSIDTYVNSLS